MRDITVDGSPQSWDAIHSLEPGDQVTMMVEGERQTHVVRAVTDKGVLLSAALTKERRMRRVEFTIEESSSGSSDVPDVEADDA